MFQPRVAHLVPALFGAGGTYGGAERYAFELSRAMAGRTPTRLISFAPRSGTPSLPEHGALDVEALRNQLWGRRFDNNPLSLRLWPHLRWADVIHCHQTHTLAADLACLVGRWAGQPVFGTDHGGGGLSFYRGAGFFGRLFVSRFSQGLAEPGGFESVVYGGVDTARFSPDAATPRSGRAVFVGRLLPHKGIPVLLQAARTAGVPLTVIGRPLDPGYFAQLRALAASSEVSFLTGCDDEALVDFYRRALCVVLPSIERDGEARYPAAELMGFALLEAMACGTPVIATAVGGMPEVVVEGETGFIVPANDSEALAAKLAWFRDHPHEAERMGEAARTHVLSYFTWSRVVDRCLEAYRIGWEAKRA